MLMQSGEGLFLIDAQLPSLLALDEAVQSLCYLHLDVERFVLLQEITQEFELAFDLLHFAHEFLGEFTVALAILHPHQQICNLQVQFDHLFVSTHGILNYLLDIARPVPMLILQFLESVVESDHSGFHFADCRLSIVFELADLLQLGILTFHHLCSLLVDRLFVSPELLTSLQHLLIHSALQLVQLGYLLLVDCHHCFHAFEPGLCFDVVLGEGVGEVGDLVVLLLDVSGFLRAGAVEKEFVVFEAFEYVGLGAFELIDLGGIFCEFEGVGLQEFAHEFSNLGFDLVPLELSDFECILLCFIVLVVHNFIIEKNITYNNPKSSYCHSFVIHLSEACSAYSCAFQLFITLP